MTGSSCYRLLSLIGPLALGCGSPALSPDGGGAPNNGDAAGRVDVSSEVGSVMLNAVPPCGAGTAPSSLLTVDHARASTPGVYSTSGFVDALLVDDTGIYIEAGFIVRAPLEGGRATALWAMQASVSSFARVDSFLWASAGWLVSGILRLPIEGTAPMFAAADEGAQRVAGASGRVFFTDFHTWVSSYGSDLASGPTITLTGQGTLIAILGSDVFIVTNTAPSATMPVETRLERGNTNGGASTIIATSASDILSIAANSTSVYWVEAAVGGATGTVRRAAHDGSNEELVANMNVSSLAVDEGAVYFAVDDGTIVETATDTLKPTILAQGQVRPSAITQYGPRVYWINDHESSAIPPTANAVMTACK